MANHPPLSHGEPEPQRGAGAYDAPTDITRLTGHGVIYRGDQRITDADYDLVITPAELRGVTFEPGNEPKVSPDITGRLLGNFYVSEPLTGVLTLRLEDGREFEFRVLQPDTNEIIGVSWFH